MRWTTWVIPLLILLGGFVSSVVLPLDTRLKLLIAGTDFFAAVLVGLILWRRDRLG